MSLGKADEALQTLRSAIEKSPEEPGLHAELASGLFQRGDYEAAEKAVQAALKIDEDHAGARWLRAELLRSSGKLDEAAAAYKWLIDLHGRQEKVADPNSLRYMGLAAAQYARWNRVSEQFSALVNDWYPAILRQDEHLWWAEYEIGRLFLEKYNQREAAKAFEAALKLNPNAAEVHAAVAELALQNYSLDAARRSLERALEINPHLTRALQLKADLLASNFEIEQALAVLARSPEAEPSR